MCLRSICSIFVILNLYGLVLSKDWMQVKEIYNFPPDATLLKYTIWASEETLLIVNRITGRVEFFQEGNKISKRFSLRQSNERIVWAACYDRLNQRFIVLECSVLPYFDENASLVTKPKRLFLSTLSKSGSVHKSFEIDVTHLLIKYYLKRGMLSSEVEAKLNGTRHHFWPGKFDLIDSQTVALGIEDIPSLHRGVLILSLDGQLLAFSEYADHFSFAVMTGKQRWEVTCFRPGEGLFRFDSWGRILFLPTIPLLKDLFVYPSPVGFLSDGSLVLISDKGKISYALVINKKGKITNKIRLSGYIQSPLNFCFIVNDTLLYIGHNKRKFSLMSVFLY